MGETFYNHRHRHNEAKYIKLIIHLLFTMDSDPKTAPEKVVWFTFDDRSTLRYLQKEYLANRGSMIPSYDQHSQSCINTYLITIDNNKYKRLKEEWLIPALWDVACPPAVVEQCRNKLEAKNNVLEK